MARFLTRFFGANAAQTGSRLCATWLKLERGRHTMTFALRAQFLASVASRQGCAFSSGATAQVEKQPSPPQNETVTDENSQAADHRSLRKAPGDAAPCAGVDQFVRGEKIQQSGVLAASRIMLPTCRACRSTTPVPPAARCSRCEASPQSGRAPRSASISTMRQSARAASTIGPRPSRSTCCLMTSTGLEGPCAGRRGRSYGATSIGRTAAGKTRPSQPDLRRLQGARHQRGLHDRPRLGLRLGRQRTRQCPSRRGQVGRSAPAIPAAIRRGQIDSIQTGKKDVNDAVQQGGCLALLWAPDPKLTVELSALWQSVRFRQSQHRLTKGWGRHPACAGRAVPQHQFAAA